MLENQFPLQQLIDKIIIILPYLTIIFHEITPLDTLINYIKFPSHWIPHLFIDSICIYMNSLQFLFKKNPEFLMVKPPSLLMHDLNLLINFLQFILGYLCLIYRYILRILNGQNMINLFLKYE